MYGTVALVLLAGVDGLGYVTRLYLLFFLVDLHFEGVLLAGVFFNEIRVFVEAQPQVLPHLFQMLDRQFLGFSVLLDESVERRLQSKAVHHSELFKDHDTGGT